MHHHAALAEVKAGSNPWQATNWPTTEKAIRAL
jgi:hypothetical protein